MVLNFKKANCKDCYKCLRGCPVKSIRVIHHQAQIMDSHCILCGHCTRICPQDAKTVQNNVADARTLIDSKKHVVVSLAPSFVAAFGAASPEQVFNALLKLGFSEIQETAIGAQYVSSEYNQLLINGADNLITSACPSVVRLMRQYYPETLQYLAPIDSPMVAHAKLIKAKKPDAAIVFIGPCISKKQEAEDSGLVNVALTFEEVAAWLKERDIEPQKQSAATNQCVQRCLHPALNYPVNRGIIKSMGKYQDSYEYICVDGVEKCKAVLSNMSSLHGFFIEMNACENACVNGPCMTSPDGGFIKSTELVRRYAKTYAADQSCVETPPVSLTTKYAPIENDLKMPSQRELNALLSAVGKHGKEDQLNCGACGYATCIDNAIAVFNGNAEQGMCVPYMRERAERIAAKIIDNSPNGIIAVDENMKIVEINARVKELLGLPEEAERGAQLADFINPTDYLLADERPTTHVFVEKTQKHLDLTLSKIPQTKMVFGIYNDVTTQSNQREVMQETRKRTVATADEVIEKQMRVVQEIASLLGETTAETQIALTRLKNLVENEE